MDSKSLATETFSSSSFPSLSENEKSNFAFNTINSQEAINVASFNMAYQSAEVIIPFTKMLKYITVHVIMNDSLMAVHSMNSIFAHQQEHGSPLLALTVPSYHTDHQSPSAGLLFQQHWGRSAHISK